MCHKSEYAKIYNMQSIQETVQKIKESRDLALMIVLLGLVVIFVGIVSFFLGHMSVNNTQKDSVYIEYPPLVDAYANDMGKVADSSVSSSEGQYVASKSGTKYYTLNCSGVSRIKEENKVYFNSTDEAENAGYEPADGCF